MRTEQVLAKAAKALEDVGEGIACAGTALESKTYTVRGKAFLFLGPKDARLKLAESAEEARALAKQPDSSVRIGAGGWTTIRLAGGVAPADSVVRRWVAESHARFRRASASASPRKGDAARKPTKAVARQRRK
jgi:hypothetical protein